MSERSDEGNFSQSVNKLTTFLATQSPMRKNRTRPFSSYSEEEILTNNLKKNRKRNRIVEQHSASEDENPNKNGEKIDASYIRKVRKIKRNSAKRYSNQTGNIVPEKIFEKKDRGCRKACPKNYNEEERKNIFEKFRGLAVFFINIFICNICLQMRHLKHFYQEKKTTEIVNRYPDQRQAVSSLYMADFNKQNLLLHEPVERKIVKRRRRSNGKDPQRNFSFRYLLSSKNGKIPVCRKFFLDTFKVSEVRLKLCKTWEMIYVGGWMDQEDSIFKRVKKYDGE